MIPFSSSRAFLSPILKNGYHRAIDANIMSNSHTASPIPPCRKPLITGGVVQGICKPCGIGTRPIFITKYVNDPKIGVININGKKNIGFNTTGIPNNNGSLMKKNVVGSDNFPNILYCLDLAKKHIKIAKPNIVPTPPNVKDFVKAPVIIYGIVFSPAWKAAKFSNDNGVYTGFVIDPTIFPPCKPKNHSRFVIKLKNKNDQILLPMKRIKLD